jgi:uncharacterized membrane protein YdcZ (DUF606 family)
MKPHLIHKITRIRYLGMRKLQKQHEQLEIGKIKFEVTSIYVGKTYLTSLFQVKYTKPTFTEQVTPSNWFVLLKIIMIGAVTLIISTYIYQKLITLGLVVPTNPLINQHIAPLLFSNVVGFYAPILGELITLTNYLTL